jgi:hypothetical protein
LVNTSALAGSGGGLAALYGSAMAVSNTTLSGCSAQSGGGVSPLTARRGLAAANYFLLLLPTADQQLPASRVRQQAVR